MAGIVLERVSRVFADGVVAVDQIDLEVRDREFLVLVGPSGCGKSTTLRMIAGLEDVSSGEIRIGGRRVNDVPPKDRDIAMVFQNYALYPHMSVRRNMGFGLELRYGTGWLRRAWWSVVNRRRGDELAARRRQITADVGRAARILGIEHLLDRLPGQLSGGERQRAALGRAIVREPAAFLFDEPLSNLDARLRVEMRRELKELHRRLATTMVYVTHDQVEALTLGDRIVVLDRGLVQQIGPPLEVYDLPRNRFVAGFIGTPPMNFLTGVLDTAGGKDNWRGNCRLQPGNALAARLRQASLSECVLGIRPEDVRLSRTGQPDAGHEISVQEAESEQANVFGTVELVEALGDATLVTVRCDDGPDQRPGGSERTTRAQVSNGAARGDRDLPHLGGGGCVVSKIESRADWRVGDAVRASFAAHRVHGFDAVTGENRAPARPVVG